MEHRPTTPRIDADVSTRRFKEQDLPGRDDAGDGESATLRRHGPLRISADEERGGDPYNHTGRFERSIR